jgi:hypothetical protein
MWSGQEMDLTIPYTFYPIALPHWIAWALFSSALLGAAAIGVLGARRDGWQGGLRAGATAGAVLLLASMIASMVVTFFVHDQ